MLRSARDNFHQVWPWTTYPCLNHSVFLILIRYVTLWPWPLYLELLEHFGVLCLNNVQNLSEIRGWVIDNLARFRVQFLGVGQNWQSFLRGAWTQLHQNWQGYREIIAALHCCFRFRISCSLFSNVGGSKLSGVLNDVRFSTFWPPVKIIELESAISLHYCWSLTYDRTSEIHLMAIHCAAAGHGGLIKKKKKQTRNRKLRMHCNLRPPEPRQPFPALITTPCQVWSRWTYPLPYYSVSAADKLLYAVTLTFDPVTLTFDLWPWTFAVYPMMEMWWNSVPNLNAIEQSAAEL